MCSSDLDADALPVDDLVTGIEVAERDGEIFDGEPRHPYSDFSQSVSCLNRPFSTRTQKPWRWVS